MDTVAQVRCSLFRPSGFVVAFLVMVLWSLSGSVASYGTLASTTTTQPVPADKWSSDAVTGSVVYYGSTLGAACTAIAAGIAANAGSARSVDSSAETQASGGGICQIRNVAGGTVTPYPAYSGCTEPPTPPSRSWSGTQWVCGRPVAGCVSGATLSSSNTCVCDLGKTVSGTSCVPYTCGPAGSYDAVTRPDTRVLTADTNQCIGGCKVVAHSITVDPSGVFWAQWPYTSTGATAFCGGLTAAAAVPTVVDTGGTSLGAAAPIACAPGTYPGTVNGAAVCVKSSGAVVTSQTTVNPDGSKTTATTTCVATNACSTVNTTTTSGGSTSTGPTVIGGVPGTAGGAGVPGQLPGDFCTDNPTSPLCKVSSVVGSCATVVCDGDAVQCTIMADQLARNCATLNAAPGNDPTVMAAAAAASSPDGHPANTPTAVALGAGFDQTDIVSGSCPADYTVATIRGTAVVMPLSKLCAPAAMLGNVLVGLTALACLGIAFMRGS